MAKLMSSTTPQFSFGNLIGYKKYAILLSLTVGCINFGGVPVVKMAKLVWLVWLLLTVVYLVGASSASGSDFIG